MDQPLLRSLFLQDQGILQLNAATLLSARCVGGKASNSATGVQSLILTFNRLQSLSSIPLLTNGTSSGGLTGGNYQPMPPLAPSQGLTLEFLVHLDVRHNRLQSLAGVEGLHHLETLLACGNPSVSSWAPLLLLENLKSLWLTRCGLGETELALLVEKQSSRGGGARVVPKSIGGGGKGGGSGNASSSNNNSSSSSSSSNGFNGFRDSLRVLTLHGCPLAKHAASTHLLVAHFASLEFLDGKPVTQVVRTSSEAFAASVEGKGAMHRLKATLRQQLTVAHHAEKQQQQKQHRKQPPPQQQQQQQERQGQHRGHAGHGDFNDDAVVDNDDDASMDKLPCRGGGVPGVESGVSKAASEAAAPLLGESGLAGSVAGGEDASNAEADGGGGCAVLEECGSIVEDTDQASAAPATALEEVTLANCVDGLTEDLERMLGLKKSKTTTMPSAGFGLSNRAANSKKSSRAKQPEVGGATSRRGTRDTQVGVEAAAAAAAAEQEGHGEEARGVEKGVVEEDAAAASSSSPPRLTSPSSPPVCSPAVTAADEVVSSNHPPCPACTVYYPRQSSSSSSLSSSLSSLPVTVLLESDESAATVIGGGGGVGKRREAKPKSKLGTVAVAVRKGGSATVKWPTGGTAVSFEVENSSSSSSASLSRCSISAFFEPGAGGGLALMMDADGFGSANYVSGSTALTTTTPSSASSSEDRGGGFALSADGFKLAEWSSSSASPQGALTLKLTESLGLVYAPNAKGGGGVATVFFQCRGVSMAFSQQTRCATVLPPGMDLFGGPLDKSGGSGGGAGRRRRGGGVRSIANEAAAMPALTHQELIQSLRGATAGL